MARKHTHQSGITGSSVTIVTIAVIFALFFLKATPQLPAIIDVGGAATANFEDAYTEIALTQEFRGACFDTDAGLNQLVKGTVTVNDAVAEDACNDDKNLVEYYCQNDKLKFEFIPCSEFCREGKCVSKPKVKEHFKISQKHDGLEIKEDLGDVVEAVTSRELSSLSGGTISTKTGRTKYHQYLRFDAQNLDSGQVVYEEDESGTTDDFLKFEAGEDMFEYELQFENGLKSTIASDGKLTELEGEELNILGRRYEVVEASVSGSSASIVFMSGAIEDTLKEGASGSYQLDGIDYEIQAVIIEESNPPRVTLKINGVETTPLEDGEIYLTEAGIVVGIADILVSEAGEGSDLVNIFIGAQRLRFQDTYTDDSFSTNFDVNGELIDGGKVNMKGSRAGGEFDFISLKYRLEAHPANGVDVYVSKNRGLKQSLKEPEGMIDGWDIVYGGLAGSRGTGSVRLELRPRGDDQYDLIFINRNGNTYGVPYISNRGGTFKLGTSNYDLILEESGSSSSFNIDQEDIFIVSSGDQPTSYSAALRYDAIDVSNNVVHFDDLAVGRKSAPFTGTPGVDAQGTLLAGGTGFRFFVGPAPYALAMDMDNSGSVDSGNPQIVVGGGIVVNPGTSNSISSPHTLTITTPARLTDEGVEEELEFNIIASGNEVDVQIPTQSALPMISVDEGRVGMSDTGIFVRQVENGADKLEIGLGQGGQRFADVAIVIIEQEKPITRKVPLTAFAIFYDFIDLN